MIEMRKYQGVGDVAFPDVPIINGNFELLSEDAKLVLQLTTTDVNALKLSTMPSISGTFSGASLNPQGQITINRLYLDTFNYGSETKLEFIVIGTAKIIYQIPTNTDIVDVKRGLTNLVFYGTEKIMFGDTFIRGKTTVTVGGHDVSLVQLPNFKDIESELEESEGVKITCEIGIQGTFDKIEELEEISENIQTLCSLASGNYVVPLYEDVYCKGTLYETYLYPSKTYHFSKSPSLIGTSIHYCQEFKDFLETAYPHYIILSDGMGLPYFVEFFTTSKTYQPTEVKFLLSTTAFECLEDYFSTWQSLEKISDNLEGKMVRMWRCFDFKYTGAELTSYRKSRNSIIHQGKFLTGTDGFLETLKLRNLMDRFILFILGYSGKPYHNIFKRIREPLT
jgi:hypothetical protein